LDPRLYIAGGHLDKRSVSPVRTKAAKKSKSNGAGGYALTIGLNSVDPTHYQGWSGPLMACEADANDMAAIALDRGYRTVRTLLTREATRAAVSAELAHAAATLQSGDTMLLSYSGHGGQLPDLDGEEDDGMDETWCLFDGEFVDDEIYDALGAFAPGVRILVLSDSCHSGTVTKAAYYSTASRMATLIPSIEAFPRTGPDTNYRAMPAALALQTYRANRAFYDPILLRRRNASARQNVKASVLLISGCQDNQLSLDGTFNGLFTGTLLRVWNGGKFTGDHRSFHHMILSRMPPDQSPNYFWAGPVDSQFEARTPFTP
jgi:hypothetical protein